MPGRFRPDSGVYTTPGRPANARAPRNTLCGPRRPRAATSLRMRATRRRYRIAVLVGRFDQLMRMPGKTDRQIAECDLMIGPSVSARARMGPLGPYGTVEVPLPRSRQVGVPPGRRTDGTRWDGRARWGHWAAR